MATRKKYLELLCYRNNWRESGKTSAHSWEPPSVRRFGKPGVTLGVGFAAFLFIGSRGRFNETVMERLSCASQVSTGYSEPCRVRYVPRSNRMGNTL